MSFSLSSVRTGIKNAILAKSFTCLDDLPANVNTANLPLAWLGLERLSASWRGLSVMWTSVWFIDVIATPVAQKIRPEQRAILESAIQTVMEGLIEDPTLGGSADHIETCSSGGMQTIQVADVMYLGSRITLEVINK